MAILLTFFLISPKLIKIETSLIFKEAVCRCVEPSVDIDIDVGFKMADWHPSLNEIKTILPISGRIIDIKLSLF